MDGWNNFYYLCGSSGAGLTGLMFIAVTFGSSLVRKDSIEAVNVFMTPICFHFLHVFLLCCVAVMPLTDATVMGLATLLSGLYRFAGVPQMFRVIKRFHGRKESEVELSDWLLSLVGPSACYAALIVTGVLYLIGSWFAPVLLAIVLISLLGIGVRNAWEMLIWMAMRHTAKSESKSA